MNTTTTFPADFRSTERVVIRFGEKYVVRATRIIGTDTVVLRAFDTAAVSYTGRHASLFRSEAHGLLGDVTSRCHPEVEALAPLSQERMDAAHLAHARDNEEAEMLMRLAFPELDLDVHRPGSRVRGEYWVKVAS